MALFKCKMCGGALEIENNASIATCEYCGTTQTLPKIDDERKANLYDRANHFRRNNEFDKAMGIYEQILNEDNTDSEAYWSLVLCSYGIEYVEDPVTHKRVPTVNRAQYTSVFDDDNYKSALQYADGFQKSIYEQEAVAINEIQKGILAISQKEDPFDVFICYKETDNNGRRTPDSVLANDLYHQLTQEGFKVFFARITLEDKLGSAYEPYIFAALNSAKVMVALGTKPEYFNAVWVKNEWSRYLALIKNGAKKMLIPAYKDMDPYDLPEEFSHLQAQDMSKLGFMQDLIRGIKKITQTDEPKQTTVVKETVIAGGNASTAPLLKRAFMFIEDGDWNSADEYCEKVLDIDPENATAYLGKLLSELKIKRKESLKYQAEPFDDNNNYQKIVRFGEDDLKNELKGYIDFINERNETARKNGILADGKAKMGNSILGCEQAIKLFESIPGWKDADEQIVECQRIIEELKEKEEIARKDRVLANGKNRMNDGILGCEDAIRLFKSIHGWKDADEQIVECHRLIKQIEAEMEANRLEQVRLREIELKKTKMRQTIAAVVAVIVSVVIAALIIFNALKRKNAFALFNEEKYNEAYKIFDGLDGYKDSSELGKYAKGYALMEEGKYEEAYEAIDKIYSYNDNLTLSKYAEALLLMKEGKYEESYELFVELGDYNDSSNYAKYAEALVLMDENKYEEAIVLFESLGSYRDSADLLAFLKNIGDIASARVGDLIMLGQYKGNFIMWTVLERKDDKILVISRDVLENMDYNRYSSKITRWAASWIRQWLNNDFLKAAFSSSEIEMISPVDIKSAKVTVQDKVFLLSEEEVKKYFNSSSERVSPSGNLWLLRNGYYVETDGTIVNSGKSIEGGVRPAMWIDLNP